MKIRQCFVSNSSSSNFAIYKKLMSEQQIEYFRNFLKKNGYFSGDGYYNTEEMFETDTYFIGYPHFRGGEVVDFLLNIGVKKEHICNVCDS